MTPRYYVATSLQQIRNGTDREGVLETLLAIARNDESRPRLGADAVRALFHIADDDPTIRRHLLMVIGDPRTSTGAHRAAVDLLVYVCDAETRGTVLDLFKNDWPPKRWAGYLSFFVDVGDTAFLRWAEEALAGYAAGSSHRRVLEDVIARIRAQETLDDLLAYLRTTDKPWNATWALRQACRHGATRERIRAAVLSLLNGPGEDGAAFRGATALVQQCDALGVLQPQDAEDSPVITRARGRARAVTNEKMEGPAWSLPTIEAKKAAFYRFEALRKK